MVERSMSPVARSSLDLGRSAVAVAIRTAALAAFLVMSLAEPFLAVILGGLAIGCFSVSVLFGFILRAPFPHRWFVLGASVVFLMVYVLYRFLMQGVQRLLN